jgi:hypothetical protein
MLRERRGAGPHASLIFILGIAGGIIYLNNQTMGDIDCA